MSGNALALAALLGTVGNWGVYWPKIKAMRVPLRPRGHQAVMVAAMIVAVLAFVRGTGTLGGIAAGLAFVNGGMMLFFTMNSAVPKNVPAVNVGERILDFEAKDARGNGFTLSSLRGTPFLLKFFRGHW